MKTLQRYGTILRIFDNGGKTADRFTIMPPRWASRDYRENRPGEWIALACNDHPFHPLGFGMHVSAIPGSHLGKRISWGALPVDVQRFARQSFPAFAPTELAK